MTKLIAKVEDMISADLEGVNSPTVTESRKLMANTILSQLWTKRDQIMELDTAIVEKIEDTEFEEETINTDTNQLNLELPSSLSLSRNLACHHPSSYPPPLLVTSAVNNCSDTSPVSPSNLRTHVVQ